MIKPILFISILFVLISCSEEKKEPITNKAQYDQYLSTAANETYKSALNEKEFWSERLTPDSTGVGNLAPLGGAYEKMFAATGKASYLHDAEKLYKKGIEFSYTNSDGYTRALAHNYISQHRFKEAKQVLEKAYAGVSHKRSTEYMLFDVYMELGEYDKADEFLGKLKNNSDYNYLIRLAKWSDHKGNLDAAIKYLEQAMAIAESRDSKPLKIWTYSNIADFYGHAGRIDDAYTHYLKTLELDPENAYSIKGIAWILYSEEGNTTEANRLLDSLMVNHKLPDYYLLKAEMAEFDENSSEVKKMQQSFTKAVNEGNYGNMYNTYLIELYAESDPKKALALAQKEVSNRATPETYQLLAYAQLQNNDKEGALKTIEQHVEGKTFEPMAQYYSALVYKANNVPTKVEALKEELMEAGFELGPVMLSKIKNL